MYGIFRLRCRFSVILHPARNSKGSQMRWVAGRMGEQEWAVGKTGRGGVVGGWANGQAQGGSTEVGGRRMEGRGRCRPHGRGCSVLDEGMESPMRAWCHGRGHGEGGVSSTDEGTVRGMSAPRMRRAARTVGCAAMHALQPAGVDVPGGHDRDDGGGGAGGAAVPHLQCVADAHPPRGAGAAAQFMMRALGCMSDGKGAWG